MINREDMLELTRRMTPSRTCFKRIAGAYMTAEGELEDSFNINFLNLKLSDREKQLMIAKTVPFSKTNEQLKEHSFPEDAKGRDSMFQLLNGMLSCGLKNDLLMEVFYEQVGIFYETAAPYCVSVYNGTYDVPMKSTDHGYLYESEIVYDFLVCTVAPLKDNYESGKPEFGFLYPAFSWRMPDRDMIDIYNKDPDHPQTTLTEILLGLR